jgi:hypothetical protein
MLVCCIDIYYLTIKYLLLFVEVAVVDATKCGISVLVNFMLLMSVDLIDSGTCNVLVALSMIRKRR